jgi:hypothetical protein
MPCKFNQRFKDFYQGGPFHDYVAITADGHYILQWIIANIITIHLYPGGLNAIAPLYDYPFDFVITVGNNGKIFRKSEAWSVINSGTTVSLNDVTQCRNSYVFVIGESGTILKSTNLGQSFFPLNSGTTLDLNEIYCFSEDSIRIAADSLTTIYTTNGGVNWIIQRVYETADEQPGFRVDLKSLHFINFNTGWIWSYYIFKTTNGGLLAGQV